VRHQGYPKEITDQIARSSSKNAVNLSSARTTDTIACSLIVARLLFKDGAYSLLIEP